MTWHVADLTRVQDEKEKMRKAKREEREMAKRDRLQHKELREQTKREKERRKQRDKELKAKVKLEKLEQKQAADQLKKRQREEKHQWERAQLQAGATATLAANAVVGEVSKRPRKRPSHMWTEEELVCVFCGAHSHGSRNGKQVCRLPRACR
jgi:colicin import membrane protein